MEYILPLKRTSRSLYRFHFYFATTHLLFQMEVCSPIGALPGDPRSTLFKTLLIFSPLIGFEVKLGYLQTRVFGSHITITKVW